MQSKNAFGTFIAPSPFLTQPTSPGSSSSYYTDSADVNTSRPGVHFGADFTDSLLHSTAVESDDRSREPVVTSPSSSTSSTSACGDDFMDGVCRTSVYESANDEVTIEECDDEPVVENRVVVYRPPVQSSPQAFSQLNARLPHGKYIFRNPRTKDWIITESHNDRMKRKLAIVPWRDAKRFCESAPIPQEAIPMPWHDTDEHVNEMAAMDADRNAMEVEEIS